MANSVTLTFDDAALKEVQAAIADGPRRFLALINTKILPTAQKRIDGVLNQTPGSVKLPFEFATVKSRRYYFATHQPPYKRTGKSQQWKLVMQSASGEVVEIYLENPMSYARWLFGTPQGTSQTPGHLRTGWATLAAHIPVQQQLLLTDVSAAWLEIAIAPLRKIA